MLQNLRNCRNIGITYGSPLRHIKYYVVNFKDTNKSILSIQQMYNISVEVHNQLFWNNIFTFNYIKFAFVGVFCYKLILFVLQYSFAEQLVVFLGYVEAESMLLPCLLYTTEVTYRLSFYNKYIIYLQVKIWNTYG